MFRRLFLGSIDASDSESRLIFQHFSSSTRFSISQSKFCVIYQNLAKWCNTLKKSVKMCENLKKSANFDFVAVRRCENLVDLEKSEKMRQLSLSEASIQPRTSLQKFWGDSIVIQLILLFASLQWRGTLSNDTAYPLIPGHDLISINSWYAYLECWTCDTAS